MATRQGGPNRTQLRKGALYWLACVRREARQLIPMVSARACSDRPGAGGAMFTSRTASHPRLLSYGVSVRNAPQPSRVPAGGSDLDFRIAVNLYGELSAGVHDDVKEVLARRPLAIEKKGRFVVSVIADNTHHYPSK